MTSPSFSVNISKGSPSRIRMVRRISLGITTRPRSSIFLTMPVAFIAYLLLLCLYAGFSMSGLRGQYTHGQNWKSPGVFCIADIFNMSAGAMPQAVHTRAGRIGQTQASQYYSLHTRTFPPALQRASPYSARIASLSRAITSRRPGLEMGILGIDIPASVAYPIIRDSCSASGSSGDGFVLIAATVSFCAICVPSVCASSMNGTTSMLTAFSSYDILPI